MTKLTLCNYEAVTLKTDRKHREDSFCRRCIGRIKKRPGEAFIQCSTRTSERIHYCLEGPQT